MKELPIPHYIMTEVLEEISSVLTSLKNKDEDCISLYEVSQLIKAKTCQYKRIKDSYGFQIEEMIKEKYPNAGIVVYNFDYNKSELTIGFRTNNSENYEMISFSKHDEDLFIKKTTINEAQYILDMSGDIIKKLYDEFVNYEDFVQQHNCINAINSNFLIDIDCYGVSVLNRECRFNKYFELESTSYENQYAYDCNSYTIISAIKGNEEKLFKRIFIKIEDCPQWSQSILYEMRQKQLEEEQKIEEEKNRNKQKRLY